MQSVSKGDVRSAVTPGIDSALSTARSLAHVLAYSVTWQRGSMVASASVQKL